MRTLRTASVTACGTALLLAACEPRAEAPNAAPQVLGAPLGAPTLEELTNATYAGLQGLAGPVTLEDGRWEGEPFEPGAASRPSVSLAPGFRLTGDLDGDGADEAVVVLAQSSGGSGTSNSLAVVKRTPEGLRNVATTGLGDRVGLRSARVESGTLLVSVVRAGEKDAMCCPGELADLGWTLAGGKLSPVATAGVTGRLSLDTLAGTEWVLRAWDLEEPAPAEPAVTLAYRDGHLTGTSGCNRYTAAAKAGASPGDLTIGPAAGTRMACPEPHSAVEARFLRQLGGAKRFGFHLGRLALSYEKDGGAHGTMLFEGRTPAAAADEPVPALQDLMGAKGASVETALTSRGYAFLGLGEGTRSDFQYWREPQTGRCVGVKYLDNRVQAVAHAANAECEKAAVNKPKAPTPSVTGFHTVCGVTVDGKPYRYKCTVEGAGPGGPGQTTLHFPDNTVTLKWLGAKKASATFAGMNPQEVDVTTAEGMTQFLFEGKPYFWVSDRRAAELELQSLR